MGTKISYIVGLLFLLLAFSCDDKDGEISASLVGKWSDEKADFELNPSGPLPPFTITRDDLSIVLEFKSDGSLILTDKNQVATTGTYTLTDRSLVINIGYDIEFISLSGTYAVQELTQTKLRIEIKKDGTFTHPDTGQTFEGEITVTLYFDRA